MKYLSITQEIITEIAEDLVYEDALMGKQYGTIYSGEVWTSSNFIKDIVGKWDLSYYAVFHNKICGFLICSLDKEGNAHINRLLICEEMQRKGIGNALINLVKKKAFDMGCSEINLFVNADNQFAVSFYKKLGFSKVIGKMLENKLSATKREGFCDSCMYDSTTNTYLFFMSKKLEVRS